MMEICNNKMEFIKKKWRYVIDFEVVPLRSPRKSQCGDYKNNIYHCR